ncbi:endonuclease YncB(thermonuclease family) [Sphingomonas jinjuensis]|uniref:Endonuclease YncB(Thermonuclease family) n=1 Tax=Sphingomonas jinjuensis TaxID=535907 RepID=A0A840FHY2_9SPHN|nr:hypothetical protein [Sphingomonas jinjuensis]MBB4155314.1 endonuclease YncB(thermonuclease family) [Sphingomonas jinjuensis]
MALPPLPPGFSRVEPTQRKRKGRRQDNEPAQALNATGQAHDGDTFRLSDGRNARLLGVDAFELDQTGRASDGSTVRLGELARSALVPNVQPGATVTPNGSETYGRPVASVLNGDQDTGRAILHAGLGLSTPEYLRGDQQRLQDYTQEERLARLNRRGAFAGSFQTPKSYRQGNPDPWKAPEAGTEANGQAVFWDDPTPFQGLKPEVEKGYIDIWQDMSSKPEDLIAYAKANGFQVNPDTVRKQYAARNRDQKAGSEVQYMAAPRVLTDLGDGRTGAALRGFADPINMLDEAGAVVDSLLPGSERENVWGSDRRFGDIYANNLEQNRSILANDDATHPYYRFGGQLASGLVTPGASVEGVGYAAARRALLEGSTRIAARSAARRAVLNRMALTGGIEGGLAGAGAGETTEQRAKGAAIGAPVGATLGVGLGVLAPKLAAVAGKPFSKLAGRDGEQAAGDFVDGALDTARARASNDAQDAANGIPDDLLQASPPLTGGRAVDLSAPHLNAKARKAISERKGLDPNISQFGPVHHSLSGKWDEALARMEADGTGDIPAAVKHPEAGNLDLVWGNDRYGVKRVLDEDPAAAERLPEIIASLPVREKPSDGSGRWVLENDQYRAVVSPDHNGPVKRWVVSSFDNKTLPPIDAEAGALPALPDGMQLVARERDSIDMRASDERPTLTGPEMAGNADGTAPRPLTADATRAERLADAERLSSRDVLPLPANTVDGVDEAARIEAGRYAPVKAGDEASTLDRRTLPNANTGTPIPKRGPADLVTWLRSQGGVKAQGGELAHSGIDNTPRKGMDFAEGEKRFGPLVANDGMSYDEAAQRAWEAGYFPDHAERPTVDEFLDALEATHSGRNRSFLSEDLPEVDRFNAARQQRYDVERARDQGAPLSEDRAAPVDMADLDANAAPVRAYEEWGENAPNLAGNIRLDKLDSPQAIKRALVQTEQVTGGFDAARRGRITHAETESLANELGMTADDLLKRRKGQAFNAEEALAARQILARSATDLVNMAKRISRTENPGDEAEAAFREAWLRHAAIQEQVSGMTAEAGRALQQFRQTADARQVGRVLPTLGDIAGGSARLKEVAERIVDLEAAGTSPGGINRFAVKSLRARTRDMAMEYYINALLSGPQTHATNILSNTLTSLAQLPEHAAAAAVGAVRQTGERVAGKLGFGVRVDQDRVLFSEVPARFAGLIQGTKEGLRDAVRTFRTGDSPDNVTKVETQQYKAIPGVAGEIIRTPTRLLGAEDELFKGMARRMELTGLAMRMANREGLRGSALRQRAAELVENPTDEMLDKAQDYARYLTFQAPLGPVSSKIAGVSNSSMLMKFLIPFVRTPTNLLKFAVERSPAAPLLRDWRKEVLAGGARRDMAVARALVGTGIGAMFYEAALDGRITGGGPADESAKRLMLADGWQPYSVRVGDEYYSYRRLDPFSTTMGTMADMVDLGSHMTERQREKSGVLVTAAILNNLASKTWLTGVSGIAEALGDPDRYWQDFVSRTAGAVAVPALVAQVARTTDPVIREARAPMDRIRSRVPGLSDNLFPKRDVFGDPVESDGGVGPDIVSPIWKGTARNDKTIAALVDAGVTVSAPARFRKVDGKRVEWTPAEYDRLQVAVGDEAKHRLDALVKSDDWKKADDEDRQSMVRDEMKAARTAGKGLVEGGPTQLVAKSQAKRPANDTPPLPPGYRLTDAPSLPAGMRMVN